MSAAPQRRTQSVSTARPSAASLPGAAPHSQSAIDRCAQQHGARRRALERRLGGRLAALGDGADSDGEQPVFEGRRCRRRRLGAGRG